MASTTPPTHTPRGMPYVDLAHAPPAIRDEFEHLPTKLNLFRMLAHSEGTYLPVMQVVGAVFGKLALPPAHRELAVLRTAALTCARYEWVQHLPIAEGASLTAAQIEAVRTGRTDDEALFDPAQRLVLRAADELHAGAALSEATFRDALDSLPPDQVVELILVVGFYRMLAGLMTSTGLDLDPQASGGWTAHMTG